MVLVSICVWIALVTPLKYPNSVDVTELTATLPLPSDANALDAVRFELTIVVAPPVIVACLLSIWVCTADVTPLKYPNSVSVVALTATLPVAFEITARDAVKFDVVMVVAAPVIVACLASICV